MGKISKKLKSKVRFMRGQKSGYLQKTVLKAPEVAFLDKEDPAFSIDPHVARSFYYYSFGSNGWSPFTEAAQIYLKAQAREPVYDFLNHFYSTHQPANLHQACFGTTETERPFLGGLSSYQKFKPWRASMPKLSGHDGTGNQNFGPVQAQRLETETRRIIDVCDSINKHGYQPQNFKDGYIRGYLLVKEGGAHRFIITSGVHRIAALSAMGYDDIDVKFTKKMPRLIHRSTMEIWPHVQSDFCSVEDAAFLFDKYFEPYQKF